MTTPSRVKRSSSRFKAKDSDAEDSLSDCSSSSTAQEEVFLSVDDELSALRKRVETLKTENKRLRYSCSDRDVFVRTKASCDGKDGEQVVDAVKDAHPSSRGLHLRSVQSLPGGPGAGNSDEEIGLIHTVKSHECEEESFFDQIKDRAGWLVGLLCLQSLSSFIISRNESLLQSHIVIVQFLTMLVGAGGNAGNQASVRVIRGLAIGSINNRNVRPYLKQEFLVGLTLMGMIGVAGCVRAAVFSIPLPETVAITTSLCSIVIISIVLGATLPLGMKALRIDPAHSSTTIQVIMDILGVVSTFFFCCKNGTPLNRTFLITASPSLLPSFSLGVHLES